MSMALKQPYPDLVIPIGVTFELLFRYLNPSDGINPQTSAVVTGDTVVIKFKAHPNSATSLVQKDLTPDVDTGECTLLLTAEETLELGTQGHWGAELHADGGEPQVRWIQGKYTMSGWDV